MSCCNELRSSYFTVVKDRCLPPLLPLLQTEDGPTCRANDANAGFPSLFLQILIGNDVIPPGMRKHYAKGVRYDFTCSTLHHGTLKRICKKRSLYHARVTVDEDMKIRNCPEYPDHFCSVWINSRNILFTLVCANCNCGLCYYPILR